MYILYTLAIPLITSAICAIFGRKTKIAAYAAVVGMTLSAALSRQICLSPRARLPASIHLQRRPGCPR